MDTALPRYLRWHRSVGHTAKTITNREHTLLLFMRWLQQQGRSIAIADLDADTVRAWIDVQRARGLSDQTLATRVRHVRAFTNWLVREEWLAQDPLRRLAVPKTDDKIKPTLSPAEVDRLLATCERATPLGRRDLAIMLLFFSTGLRATELASLTIEDIDDARGLIMVRRGKGGKFRVVPLGAKVERALDRYLDGRTSGPLFLTQDGRAISHNTLKMIFLRRGNEAGVKANPHKWRHSAAIEYLRSGGRVEHLKEMLGHSTIDMSLKYARIAGIDLALAHQAVDPTKRLKTR